MPSCEKFFIRLGECLKESECGQRSKPSICFQELIKVGDKETVECGLEYQSYSECRIAMVNPKYRLRGPYGGSTSLK